MLFVYLFVEFFLTRNSCIQVRSLGNVIGGECTTCTAKTMHRKKKSHCRTSCMKIVVSFVFFYSSYITSRIAYLQVSQSQLGDGPVEIVAREHPGGQQAPQRRRQAPSARSHQGAVARLHTHKRSNDC